MVVGRTEVRYPQTTEAIPNQVGEGIVSDSFHYEIIILIIMIITTIISLYMIMHEMHVPILFANVRHLGMLI